MWEKIKKDGYDEIVYIPMSSGLSGTCGNAAQLAREYDPGVYVVDNHRISVTLQESVYDAAALAGQGCSAAEIKKRLEDAAYLATIYLTVPSLKYLIKGDRQYLQYQADSYHTGRKAGSVCKGARNQTERKADDRGAER